MIFFIEMSQYPPLIDKELLCQQPLVIVRSDIYECYRADEFNVKHSNKRFISLCNSSHGSVISTGLNELDSKYTFGLNLYMRKYGYYFYDEQYFYQELSADDNLTHYQLIEIPDNAIVYHYEVLGHGVYIANAVIASDKQLIQDHSLWQDDIFREKALRANISNLKYITEYEQTFAEELVRKNGYAYQYLLPCYKTYELALLAVQNCGRALQYVDPTLQDEALIKVALDNDCSIAEFIRDDLLTTNIVKHFISKYKHSLYTLKDRFKTRNIRDYSISLYGAEVAYIFPEFLRVLSFNTDGIKLIELPVHGKEQDYSSLLCDKCRISPAHLSIGAFAKYSDEQGSSSNNYSFILHFIEYSCNTCKTLINPFTKMIPVLPDEHEMPRAGILYYVKCNITTNTYVDCEYSDVYRILHDFNKPVKKSWLPWL